MDKPSIATIVVIICLLIIGLYAMGEVNYFSSKIIVEKNTDSPTIMIPSIGVQEKINNKSLSQGVLSDPGENIPTESPVILYGHRTLQGSPFLRLNELKMGDTFLIEWPNIGELNYSVTNTTIVPAEHELEADGKNSVYLITCDPIGSTENRIIVQGDLIDTNPIDTEIIKNNPQEHNALIISADTVVVNDGRILGKPTDESDAFNMLSALSGKTHQVYTGFCVLRTKDAYAVCKHVCTDVTFKKLSDEQIMRYIQSGESMDKAGSYGIQGLGAMLVEKINGDYFNVVGLPVSALSDILETEFQFRLI